MRGLPWPTMNHRAHAWRLSQQTPACQPGTAPCPPAPSLAFLGPGHQSTPHPSDPSGSPPAPLRLPSGREYLEKNYAETSGRDTLKLALRALTEVVEGSSRNIEVAVVEMEGGLRFLAGERVAAPGWLGAGLFRAWVACWVSVQTHGLGCKAGCWGLGGLVWAYLGSPPACQTQAHLRSGSHLRSPTSISPPPCLLANPLRRRRGGQPGEGD